MLFLLFAKQSADIFFFFCKKGREKGSAVPVSFVEHYLASLGLFPDLPSSKIEDVESCPQG